MEKDPDGDIFWRTKVIKSLRNIGINFLDPTNKPTKYAVENITTRDEMSDMRRNLNGVGIKRLIRPIRKIDLRMVDISDFIIVYLDPSVPTFGTHEEMNRAIDQCKPVLIVIEGGVDKTPLWLFDKANISHIFGDFNSLYEYINLVDSTEVSDISVMEASDYEWIFFDW
jgi:hypothetical protein